MIHDVVTVENRIEVDRPEIVPDHELHDDVANVLNWAPDIDPAGIEVAVLEGTVTLRGTVKYYWERLRAHQLAAQVPGVVDVVNELVIAPTEEVADQHIAHNLTRALERRLIEDVGSVRVTVQDGVVALEGSVSNSAAYHAAQEAAERTVGVVAVHNALTIRPPSGRDKQ